MFEKLIGIILFSLVGGSSINNAVQTFMEGRYFLFGWSIMIAVWMAASIFQIVLEGRV